MAKGKHEMKWNEKKSWDEMKEKLESMKIWGWTRNLPQVVKNVCPPPLTRIPTQWINTWKSQKKTTGLPPHLSNTLT